MIAPLDWPRLSGTANARALGTKQPPLPLFTQKHMLFSVFTPSLSLTNMQKQQEQQAEVRLDQHIVRSALDPVIY